MESLTDFLCLQLHGYVTKNDTSCLEILKALEDIRYELTEEFLRNHPELVWTLHRH